MAEAPEVLCSGYLVSADKRKKRLWYELTGSGIDVYSTRGGSWTEHIRVTDDTTASQGSMIQALVLTGPHLDRCYELLADSAGDRDRWMRAVSGAAESAVSWQQAYETRAAVARERRAAHSAGNWLEGWTKVVGRSAVAQKAKPRGDDEEVEMVALAPKEEAPLPPPTVADLLAAPYDNVVKRYPNFAQRMQEAGAPVRRMWSADWGPAAAPGLRDAVADLIGDGLFDAYDAEVPLEKKAGRRGRGKTMRKQQGSSLLDDDGVQLSEATLTPQQLAIVALNDADGKWEMDGAAAEAVFKLIDADGSGELTLDELLAAVDSKEVCSFLQDCNQPVLKGLLDPELLEGAFQTLDEDQSGTISADEWTDFIDAIAEKRLAFLEGKAHLTGQCYWGYGSALSGQDCMDPCGLVTKGKLKRGWLDDFWYFTKNNHPMFAIALCDPDHPLSRNERAALEFVTQGFSFMMSGMYDWRHKEGAVWDFFWHPTVFSILFVTIPGILLFKVLFMLYTCPLKSCWVDETAATPSEISKMNALRKAGHYASILFILGAMIFYALGIYMYFLDPSAVDTSRLELWIQGRLQAYIIWFCTALGMQFNPFVAKAVGPVQLGVWELQRRRVNALLTEWSTIDDHDAFPEQTANEMDLRPAHELVDGGGSGWDADLQAAKLRCLEEDFDGFVVIGASTRGGVARFKTWGRSPDGSVIRNAAEPVHGRCVYYRKPQQTEQAPATTEL